MLFVNLSLDKIHILWWKDTITLEKKNLERTLPQALKKLYDEKFFDQIFVVNWPGSFTSIRVWTLCLNMLNFLHKNKIKLYNISKIDLYSFFVNQNLLPSKGIIYIWQTKNYWLYDFANQSYEQVTAQEIENNSEKVFLDETFEDNSPNKIKIDFDGKNLLLNFQNKTKNIEIWSIWIKPSNTIEAMYMIKPNIMCK